MGFKIVFAILVGIFLVFLLGMVSSAQAAARPTKPKPTSTPTKPKPTATKPKPTAVPTAVPEPDYRWESESNPALLTEGGDYTKAWWPWFKQRPATGSAFLLVNHSEDPMDWTGRMQGSAFSPNGQIPEIVTLNSGNRKVVFEVYRNGYLIAPRWGRCIIAAQVSGPKLGSGLTAGVNFFLTEGSYNSWLSRVR